ncbi:MAG: helix-turn-helix transcriptional regulator [Anaerolineaceae bacterium]
MNFKEWMMGKFIEWRDTEKSGIASYSDFARYLGVGVNQYTQWRTGNNLPNYDSAKILASKLGPEVYELLGYERPASADPAAVLPPAVRSALEKAVRRIESLGISPDSDEAVKIFTEEISKLEESDNSNSEP